MNVVDLDIFNVRSSWARPQNLLDFQVTMSAQAEWFLVLSCIWEPKHTLLLVQPDLSKPHTDTHLIATIWE